jgi:D-aminopeptidase
VVRDAVCALAVRDKVPMPWLLPVVAETYDGWLSDAASFPVTAEHAVAALDSAVAGPIAEGMSAAARG